MPTPAVGLIILGIAISLLNWGALIASLLKRRFISSIPVIGAVCLASGMILIDELRPFAWIAVIADYGTLLLIILLPRLVAQSWSTASFNLVQSFTAESPTRNISIKLFRRRVAVISGRLTPPAPADESGGQIESFGLAGTWTIEGSTIRIQDYDADRQLQIERDSDAYRTTELNYPNDKKFDYDRLNGMVLHEHKGAG